jgi:hypothetical protein
MIMNMKHTKTLLRVLEKTCVSLPHLLSRTHAVCMDHGFFDDFIPSAFHIAKSGYTKYFFQASCMGVKRSLLIF